MKLTELGLSERGAKFLKTAVAEFEGVRLKPYLCSAGVPTIGVGHTGPDVSLKSPAITLERAMELFESDLCMFVKGVTSISPRLLTNENQLLAITSWAFNLGLARYKSSTLRRKVDADDTLAALENLVKWVYAGGKKSTGLARRRQFEALLYKGTISC